jgi:hypothetical protein
MINLRDCGLNDLVNVVGERSPRTEGHKIGLGIRPCTCFLRIMETLIENCLSVIGERKI